MRLRIQGACHARITGFILGLAAAVAISPTLLRAGGDEPPHGRPGMGGDVALRGCTGGEGREGRGVRSEARRMAPAEARGPLDEIEAALARWLPALR